MNPLLTSPAMRRVAPWSGLVMVLSACNAPSSGNAASTPPLAPPEQPSDAAALAIPSAPDATPPDAGGAPSDAAPEAAPVPAASIRVTVENIGMHIGGGPNDAATKAPIGNSVSPHFGELRACWAQVGDPSRGGDFGVDLLIPAEGGRAAVSHPRSILGPDAFRDCVVGVFAAIDFQRPKTGRTTVSYALHFTPAP